MPEPYDEHDCEFSLQVLPKRHNFYNGLVLLNITIQVSYKRSVTYCGCECDVILD